MKKHKCKFAGRCPWYDKKSKICNEEEGFYGASFPGCYRTNSEEEKKNKKKRKNED